MNTWEESLFQFLSDGKLRLPDGHEVTFENCIQILEQRGADVRKWHYDDSIEIYTSGARYRWQGNVLLSLNIRFNFLFMDGQEIKNPDISQEIGSLWLQGIEKTSFEQMEAILRNNNVDYWRLEEEEDDDPSEAETGLETTGAPACRLRYDSKGDISNFHFSRNDLDRLPFYIYNFVSTTKEKGTV